MSQGADLEKKFKQAALDVKTLTKRPDNDTLLLLYAHYKQATEGDATGARPGLLDLVGRAKFDAWAKLKGTSSKDAMKAYVDKVTALLKG